MKLLEWEGIFTPADVNTHREVTFDVPTGVEGLRIYYAYDPKRYEGEDGVAQVKGCYARYGYRIEDALAENHLPLLNHITISLDAPDGSYVGAAHRHPSRQEITLSQREASVGFHPVPIAAGRWRVVLSAHAVLSGRVTARLGVEAW